MLLMTYLIKHVFLNKTEDSSLSMFNIITGINESKPLASIYHANRNIDLMEENVIQIVGRIMINAYLSVKNVMYAKYIIFGVLVHVVVKMESI